MKMLRTLISRIRGLFFRERRDSEFADEIETHLQMQSEDNLRSGLDALEARRRAIIKLGGIEQIKQNYRDQLGPLWFETALQDIRFGLRMLRKTPVLTAVAVISLALGVGANTAMFSVVSGVLLDPFPFPHPERLVTLYQKFPLLPKATVSYPNFLDWQRQNHAFESISEWRNSGFTLTGSGQAELLTGKMVSSNFFSTLGVSPILGRTFQPVEDQLNGNPVALIGELFWRRRFAADPKVIDSALELDGKLYTVVGVVPSFRVFQPNGRNFFDDVYTPLGQMDNKLFRNRDVGLGTIVYGRLRPNVTLLQARADMEQVAQNLAIAYPDTDKFVGVTAVLLKEDVVGNVQRTLLILMGAVGFVLLIVCMNVANLLLARSTVRAQEFATRAALGASRARIIRQLLTESILLSSVGSLFGIALAAVGTHFATRILPATLPGLSRVHLNVRVLAFTLGISIITGIMFGLVPALRISRLSLQGTLKACGRGVIGGRHRAQGIFIVSEVAIALVLLVGAGLMIRSLIQVWNVDPGFDPHGIVTFGVGLPASKVSGPPITRAAVRELTEHLAKLPGTPSVSLVTALPLTGYSTLGYWAEGKPKPTTASETRSTLWYGVEPDFFKTMRIPLPRGRVFTQNDDESVPIVIVVDEQLANSIFPGQNPIGKRLNIGLFGWAQIVGVVGHIKAWGLDKDDSTQIRTQLYLPFLQLPSDQLSEYARFMGVVLRTSNSSPVPVELISKAVGTDQAMFNAITMDDIVARSLADRKFFMFLLSSFAAVALVLAVGGIYGVISYLVSERTHEIGIRMALGARKIDILKIAIGDGLRMAMTGLCCGISGALVLTRLLSSLLFGVRARDPVTFVSMSFLLAGVAALACYIPARRAMRVDPMVALRHE